MIIKADRWPLYQRPYTDFLPHKVSGWWPCVQSSHIPGNGDIYDDVHTSPPLNLQSISCSQPWSPPGHDWVPYPWSNSKLIFLILNNEKPWAPWRRNTEKLIDQLSLSFFKPAPYVQSRTEGRYGHSAVIFDSRTLDTLHVTQWGLHKPGQIMVRYQRYGAAVRHLSTGCLLPYYHKLFSG